MTQQIQPSPSTVESRDTMPSGMHVSKTAYLAHLASAINANICTGFTVILAIQHSHIFVGETSKMCRRNVQPVSAKRLSSKRLVETSVLRHVDRFQAPIGRYRKPTPETSPSVISFRPTSLMHAVRDR